MIQQMLVRLAVYLRLETYKAKVQKALDLKRAIVDCLAWLYLSNNPDFPRGVKLKSERKVVVAGAAEFLEWPFQDINEQQLGEDMDLAEKVTEGLSQIPAAQKLKAKSYLADAYIVSLLEKVDVEGREERIESKSQSLEKARRLDEASQLLDEKSLKSSIKEVKKDARSYMKEFRFKRTPKINIDPKDLTLVISLMSTIFLASGYIHTRILLSRFNFDSSDFFNLTDYLAASLDEIQSAAIGGLAALVGLWLGYLRLERLTGDERSVQLKESDTPFNIVIIVSAIGFVWAYLHSDIRTMFNTGSILFLLVIVIKLSPSILRYFERPSPVAVLFSAYWLGIFLLSVIESSFTTALDVRDQESTKHQKYRFEMADGSVSEDNLVTITANSAYFFVYDLRSEQVTAIPKGQIVSVSPITKKRESGNGKPTENDNQEEILRE